MAGGGVEELRDRARKEFADRLRRHHSPEAIGAALNYLCAATQRNLFQLTPPLPPSGSVIEAAEEFLEHRHGA